MRYVRLRWRVSTTVVAIVLLTVFWLFADIDLLETVGTGQSATFSSSPLLLSRRQKDSTSTKRGSRTRSVNSKQLPVTFVNNGHHAQLFAYVVGQDEFSRPIVLQPSGQWYAPQPTSAVPQSLPINASIALPSSSSNLTIIIPGKLTSGRIYVSEGELQFQSVLDGLEPRMTEPDFMNPADLNFNQSWSCLELTIGEVETYVDVSYVDFVSLPLGFQLGLDAEETLEVRGVSEAAGSVICEGLQHYASEDGQPWDQLCQYDGDGRLVRVLSPQKYMSGNGTAFVSYYDEYVTQVYQRFSNNIVLEIQGQNHFPQPVVCTVTDAQLLCEGANRAFHKLTTADIFACDGTLGLTAADNDVVHWVVPRLCAAFQRSTLLQEGGQSQPALPSTMYYQSSPTNRYAALVHAAAGDGIGYAFPYDDVHPDGARDESGLLHRPDIRSLTIMIGSP